MRLLQKSLAAGLAIAIAGTLAPAYASTCRPHHVRHTRVSVVTHWRAPVYRAAYVRPYDFYVPTRVVRCYPARAVVQDQVGFTAAIVPLGHCG